jgi:parvulin-like peptidyl-prolyl isomerase
MNTRFRLLVVAATATLVTSACAAADFAATVNDTTISGSEVTGLRTADVGAVVDGEQVRNDLTTLIVLRSELDAANEDFGLTGLDSPDAREAWLAAASPQQLAQIEGISGNPELTEEAVDVVVTQLVVRDAVIGELVEDPGFQQDIWDTQQPFAQVCPRHIVVRTEAEAAAARDRILGGEDFGTVAADVSLDPSPGGQLLCPSKPRDYLVPFDEVVATAPIGELTEPFETAVGWHIVIVDSREEAESFEEFAEEPERWIPLDALDVAWVQWRESAVARADIVVRSQIGRWFPQGDGILPPPESP